MRLRWAIAAGFIAIVLVSGGLWLSDRQQQAALQQAEYQETQRLAQALDRPVDLPFAGPKSVQSWLDEFTRQTGLPVWFHLSDEPSLHERQTRLFTLRDSAREALLQLGDEQGFHWHPDADLSIHLYSPNTTDLPPREIRRHALPLGLSSAAAQSLRAMVDSRWPSPHGGDATLASPTGELIVTQPYDVQLRIERFLQELELHLQSVSGSSLQGLLPDDPRLAPLRFAGQRGGATEIQAALDRRMSLDVVDEPLVYVIARIADAAGIAILLTKKIEDAGVHPDQPITFCANNLRVAAILRQLLSKLNLTYITKENQAALRITTVEDSFEPEHLITLAYPVSDFRRPNESAENEELAQIIRSITSPSWHDHFVSRRVNVLPDLLLISQRADVHERIAGLLHALRTVRSGKQRQVHIQKSSPHRDLTLSLLQKPCELIYDNVPLNEIAADIERRMGIPIFLAKEIEDAGVQPDHRVSCRLEARPLEENLRRLLAEKHLTIAVDEELVLVTTVEDARTHKFVETEVIDLRHMGRQWRPEELVDLIPTVVEPDGWEIGEDDRYEYEGLLIIRQRRDLLAQIRYLLTVLDSHAQPGAPRAERGNLLAKMPFDWPESERSSLYDVRDLLKPRGKYTRAELIEALNNGPFEPIFDQTHRSPVPIYSHSHELISAYLEPEEIEILEARLMYLRK